MMAKFIPHPVARHWTPRYSVILLLWSVSWFARELLPPTIGRQVHAPNYKLGWRIQVELMNLFSGFEACLIKSVVGRQQFRIVARMGIIAVGAFLNEVWSVSYSQQKCIEKNYSLSFRVSNPWNRAKYLSSRETDMNPMKAASFKRFRDPDVGRQSFGEANEKYE